MKIIIFSLLFSFSAFAKTAIVIPGYLSKAKTRGWPSLIKGLESNNYKVHFLPIKWRSHDMTDYRDQILRQVANIPSEDLIGEVLLISSSLGGFITSTLIKEIPVTRLLLASPAPLFEEYRYHLKKFAWPNLAVNVLYKNSHGYYQKEFCDYINNSNIETHIVFGSKETRDNRMFAYGLNECLEHNVLHKVTRGNHGVRNKRNNTFLLSLINKFK